MGAALFILMTNNGLDYQEIVLKTSGAMIGMIPSGLFLLTSVALAVGVVRLAQNNTLVQELYCIEMLARIDTLCLDKTGTITDGSMAVKGVLEVGKEKLFSVRKMIPQLLYVLNDSNLTNEALVSTFGKLKPENKVTEVLPFS